MSDTTPEDVTEATPQLSKNQRIANLEAMVMDLAQELADRSSFQHRLTKRIEGLERREIPWVASPDSAVLIAIGPRSGDLYSIVSEFDGNFVLNWPGGTCHCQSVDQLKQNVGWMETSWEPRAATDRPTTDEGEMR